jgi:Sulfite exporter TauE/SafE.
MGIDLISVIVVAATLATAFLSSIFGMLGGLILMGILVSLMQVGSAMILHGLIQMTSNGYRAWLNQKDINWKIVSTLFLGNVLAMATLFFIAFVPDRITVLLALGILPYIAWAMPSNLAFDVTKTPIGILAGIVVVGTNLLAGVGGPLLDVFFQRVEMTRHQVVATKAVAQFLGHVSKVIFFGGLAASSSSENWPAFWLLIIAMTVSVIGTTLGKRVLDKINDKTFFSWTQRIMLTVGRIMIARTIYLILFSF